MRRLFRLSLFVALLGALTLSVSNAKPEAKVSGRVGQDEVRVFVKDSVYIIDRQYTIAGTLIIEPGTEVKFYPNGRLIDSVGGRIIADGFAHARYNAHPYRANGTQINPIAPNSGYTGYADLDYFTYEGYYDEDGDGVDDLQRTIYVDTERDLTVHEDKYNYVFNVLLDKDNRTIRNLRYDGEYGMPNPEDAEVVTFEEALMFYAARMNVDPDLDNRININSWKRLNDKDVDIEQETIKFVGQPFNVSREWGHIIILPGARAAFFRNCTFDGFRKDTTVDRTPLYDDAPEGTNLAMLNTAMRHYTNGSGGAISTFSSRTWLLDCEFTNNMARYRGGALQILQAPQVFPKPMRYDDIGFYPMDKNPNLTDKTGMLSTVNSRNGVLRIDLLDESYPEPMTDGLRQAYDDARIAVYLGRMRNLTFTGNKVDLSEVKSKIVNGVPFVYHDYDVPAHFPQEYGNWAMGGAIFIEGSPAAEERKMEVGLGVNHSINVYTDREDHSAGTLTFPDGDTFEANGNSANNYQESMNSFGARGGAIYVGDYTSLIVAGEFISNETYAKFLQDPGNGSNSGYYSMGGAIFTENSFGRLQVRGGPERDMLDNNTLFQNNKAGAGGAIFVDGNTDPMMSPIIGGSDYTANTRDYGYNILFENNYASSFGGAIFAKRNFSINGSGGVIENTMLGYGGFYPVKFYNNAAGFSGGAVHVAIPNALPPLPPSQREIQVIRAEFVGNVVGEDIPEVSIPDIRGGGAFYTLNGDLNVVKGTEFRANKVYNGNGGAIAMIHPQTSSKRFFMTDLDVCDFDWDTKVANGYYSVDGPFIYDEDYEFPPDTRMLTRFLDNEVMVDPEVLETQSGTGTTQIGAGTVGQSSRLLATTWLNQNMGYAVGLNGTIVRMTNGGSDWEYQNWNFQYRLNDVYFPTYNVGVIVGDRGIILRTTNNGQSWYEVRPPVETRSLNAVHFIGSSIGYAVGDYGRVLKTTDAGQSWFDPVMESATISDLFGVYFNDSDFGFAVGERGTVIFTYNGGESWEVINANTFADLNDIYFTDINTGYIVGDFGVILRSDDGGFAWLEKEIITNESFNAVHFTDLDEGYAVGDFGVIYKLTVEDGELVAEQLTSNTSFSLFDVFFPGNSVGFAVGDYGQVIGTDNAGEDWTDVIPADLSVIDVVRYHPELRLAENGIGLGGAIYILDSATVNRIGRRDTIAFNRVRMQNNKAYTGAAVYSDNYDLKLLFERSLITGNEAYSEIGLEQNVIEGPAVKEQGSDDIAINPASSDLAGAIIYGEIQGPLPSYTSPEAANSIYDNHARFLIRLPDAPNTKGVLAGTTGIGFGGTDTLRGNYWGLTEADVNLSIDNQQGYQPAIQETFFVDVDEERHLDFVFHEYDEDAPSPAEQGPFEYYGTKESIQSGRPYEEIVGFDYQPIPLINGDDQNTVGDGSIPEKVLMSGKCYDIYDKHTDIKTADFSNRRLSPIEDFAVGIPPVIRRFEDETQPSYGKYVRRWVRDPLEAKEGILEGLQTEWMPNEDGDFTHPIGYPLFLETQVDYDGLVERSNHDERLQNETVFFVINETTGDFIRVSLKQNGEDAPDREFFSGRVELVPDLTYRNPNTILRRSAEGLYNLGTGSYLLQQLEDNPYNEDYAALRGRKYYGDQENGLGGITNIFSNRPSMPASNEGQATYFAGEKYHALPVNVGDVVRVISRTVLWTDGVDRAYEDGISFTIENSTEPPVFTGDIETLKTDTIIVRRNKEYPGETGYYDKEITEFLNKVFVTEDRDYPQPDGTYSNLPQDEKGRDSILAVTAIDYNQYYDPASYDNPDEYSRLTYSWYVDPNSGARRWLHTNLITAGNDNVENPKDGAEGYLVFQGQPINPYVVPGGEKVYVYAQNWPPHFRTVDWLRDQGFSEEEISKYIYLFSPYLHASVYDTGENNLRARYLQQDTIDFGRNHMSEYEFELFVVETMPEFLFPNTILGTFKKLNEDGTVEEVDYIESDFTCNRTLDGKVKANLTDKLRMQVDFNTDDEIEDMNAWSDWDFRYGKTAYGFMNISRRMIDGNPDDVVIDTTFYDNDGDGLEDDQIITQTRPNWLANDYLHVYGEDDSPDPLGADFTAFGKLNVRVERQTAEDLLMPPDQINGEMFTDTVFTVVANDGHGGINFVDVPVFINVQPRIITTVLPNATEGEEYNKYEDGGQMLDSSKMIKVYDPNFDQEHEFELIYADYPLDEIEIDPCYPEAGTFDLTNLKTTPDWLKINETSGLLYGVPGVKDAPKDEDVTVVVWDIIDGERQLADLITLDLRVDYVNHPPYLDNIPTVKCVEKGKPYSDSLFFGDIDLLREEQPETLTIRAFDNEGNELLPPDWTIEPASISGPLTEEELDNLKFVIKTDDFQLEEDPNDNRTTITIIIEDSDGAQSVPFELKIKISEETDWSCDVIVENTYPGNEPGDGMSAWQTLNFGTAPQLSLPSTGDGSDGNDLGQLDPQFCEYELPPIPDEDIFDARWTVPNTNGIYRNIYPTADQEPGEYTYRARVQAGGEVGNTAIYYPIVISWDMTCIPERDDQESNPSGGTWWLRDPYTKGNIFSVNMSTGETSVSAASARVEIDGSIVKVLILDDNIDAFHIVYDWTSPVHETASKGAQAGITSVNPNPVTEETTVMFNIARPGSVNIDVIDQLGNVVANVTNDHYTSGDHMISWKPVGFNGLELPNGTYTVRMVSGAVTSTYKMVVIR